MFAYSVFVEIGMTVPISPHRCCKFDTAPCERSVLLQKVLPFWQDPLHSRSHPYLSLLNPRSSPRSSLR